MTHRPPITKDEMIAAYLRAGDSLRADAESDAACLAATVRCAERELVAASRTLTGTGAVHDCRTSECRGTRLGDGSTHWTCKGCGSTWSTPRPEDRDDTGWRSAAVVALAIAGSLIVLGLGFGLGYVARGWFA